MKKKFISLLTLIVLIAGFSFKASALVNVNNSLNENRGYETKVIMLTEEEHVKYKGVDLSSSNFDESRMNNKQKELYNLLLEKEYEKQSSLLEEKEITKDIFISEIKYYLYNEYSNKVGILSTKSTKLISVEALGSALNVVITAALIATGVGSIGELVKNLGKEGAKKWVKKHLTEKVVGVLANVGAKKMSKWVGGFVVGIVDTYLDPGTFLAKKLDSKDSNPNSGYIELW